MNSMSFVQLEIYKETQCSAQGKLKGALQQIWARETFKVFYLFLKS